MLPVLVAFKERYPDWQIISLFGHKLVYQKLQQNEALFAEFEKISDLNVVPQELEALFTQNITPDQVKIISGMLEGSNVEPIIELTKMVDVLRSYQSTAKLLQTFEDLQRKSIEQVGQPQ